MKSNIWYLYQPILTRVVTSLRVTLHITRCVHTRKRLHEIFLTEENDKDVHTLFQQIGIKLLEMSGDFIALQIGFYYGVFSLLNFH